MKTWRKAVSPLIATMILIAICVAGGLLIYNVFFSTSGIITAKGQLTIEATSLVRTADNVTFSITIKNSGNKPLSANNPLSITLDGENPWLVSEAANLQPGQSVSIIKQKAAGGITKDYVVGNIYAIVIMATFSDGSTYSYTTSVQCSIG